MTRPPTKREIDYGCALERREDLRPDVPRAVVIAAIILLVILLVLLTFGGPVFWELLP